MQFFKKLSLLFFILTGAAQASDLSNIIESKTYGSCETNNLLFSAMKFYKIPLNTTYQGHDVFLRLIFFFNLDGSFSTRTTMQALMGCQTTSSGEEVCSYGNISDMSGKSAYKELSSDTIKIELGTIQFFNPENINRGFKLTFGDDSIFTHLRNQSFIGGMVSVNFNQDGLNSNTICR